MRWVIIYIYSIMMCSFEMGNHLQISWHVNLRWVLVINCWRKWDTNVCNDISVTVATMYSLYCYSGTDLIGWHLIPQYGTILLIMLIHVLISPKCVPIHWMSSQMKVWSLIRIEKSCKTMINRQVHVLVHMVNGNLQLGSSIPACKHEKNAYDSLWSFES